MVNSLVVGFAGLPLTSAEGVLRDLFQAPGLRLQSIVAVVDAPGNVVDKSDCDEVATAVVAFLDSQ